MGRIQCEFCGGMVECVNGTEGVCPYCGRTATLRRISSFKGCSNADVLRLQRQQATAAEESLTAELPLALCHLRLGNYQLAQKCLGRLIESAPDACEPYYYFAITLLNGTDMEELSLPVAKQAAANLKTAIALNPDFLFPKLLYALLCIDYFEANELLPPDDGWSVLKELDVSCFDAEELDFLQQSVKSKHLQDI